MDIRVLDVGNRKRLIVLAQGLAGTIGEGWKQRFPLNPVVAFGTQINLPVTRELRRIQNAA
jgi:hypothetical protein